MNCLEFEKKILLAQSNELPDSELKLLREHIESCERCMAYERNLNAIMSVSQRTLSAGEPSRRVMNIIRDAANDRLRRSAPVWFMRSPWTQVLAYAAAIALVVGGWMMMSNEAQTDKISEINALLALVSEDDISIYDVENEGEEVRLRDLADTLLKMEGFIETASDEFDWLDQLPELTPTTSRSHSNLGHLSEKCV
ncbi:MAG: zf-HC2 domain-containing protein [Lentisphaerae bacterium]|nr:zf-HC2 domain-containing protein [Lentisphaerota bacterium]